jgi:hypothetical protein
MDRHARASLLVGVAARRQPRKMFDCRCRGLVADAMLMAADENAVMRGQRSVGVIEGRHEPSKSFGVRRSCHEWLCARHREPRFEK